MWSSIKQYFSFRGRTTRSRFFVSLACTSMVFNVIGNIFAGAVNEFMLALAVILALLPAMVRRLHDAGRSGGHLAISFFSGPLLLLLLLVIPPTKGPNIYGPDPRDGPVSEEDLPDEAVLESGMTVSDAARVREGAVWVDHSRTAAAQVSAHKAPAQGKSAWPQFEQAKKQAGQQPREAARSLANQHAAARPLASQHEAARPLASQPSTPSAPAMGAPQSAMQISETVIVAGKKPGKRGDKKSKDLIFG